MLNKSASATGRGARSARHARKARRGQIGFPFRFTRLALPCPTRHGHHWVTGRPASFSRSLLVFSAPEPFGPALSNRVRLVEQSISLVVEYPAIAVRPESAKRASLPGDEHFAGGVPPS